jgi:hypothetical protein
MVGDGRNDKVSLTGRELAATSSPSTERCAQRFRCRTGRYDDALDWLRRAVHDDRLHPIALGLEAGRAAANECGPVALSGAR